MSKASIVMLAAIGAAALVVPAVQAGTVPKLRVVGVQPLVVRGESFRPGERVTITALTASGFSRALTRASSAGRFKATVRSVARPCGTSLGVRALGNLGSRATLRLPGVPCVPPPVD
jgi:hypothetical protein